VTHSNSQEPELRNRQTGKPCNRKRTDVYGWQSYTKLPDGTYKFDTESQIEPINLYSDDVNKNKRMIAAKATTYAIFEGNLDASYSIYSSAASGTSSNNRFTMPVTVYDSLGTATK